jgi:hypothetical protein
MNENTTKLLEQLAEKLGTTIDKVWGILVAQAKIDAYQDFIWSLVFTVITLFLARMAWNCWRLGTRKDEDEPKFISGILVIVGLITGSFIVGFLLNGISSLLNPEYWALNQILSKLK